MTRRKSSPPPVSVWSRCEFNLRNLFMVAVLSLSLGWGIKGYFPPDRSPAMSHFKTEDDEWAIKLTYEGEDYFNTWKPRGEWVNSSAVPVSQGNAPANTMFVVDQQELENAYKRLRSTQRGKNLIAASIKAD